MTAIGRWIVVAICGSFWGPGIVYAHDGVTVDELIRRAQIPLATISPDGRFAAYLLVRADPVEDTYSVAVTLSVLQGGVGPRVLTEYSLSPSEAFDESEGFRSSAGELRWSPKDTLFFFTRVDGKTKVMSWNADTGRQQSLTDKHDHITVDSEKSTDKRLVFVLTDSVERPKPSDSHVGDRAWRMRDAYRFYGPFRNPTAGKWTRSQSYILSLGSLPKLVPEGPPREGWESVPAESGKPPANAQNDSTLFRYDLTVSPNGALTAAVEGAMLGLNRPESSYTSSRIILLRGQNSTVLVPFVRPMPKRTILGWAPDSESFYYVDVGSHESIVRKVSIAGDVTEVYKDTGQLDVPGEFYNRKGQALSGNGDTALLVRSTNVMPGELVALNFSTAFANVISAPNEAFVKSAQPEVRFYTIELPGSDVYGRLYMPLHYQKGTRYPLVIAQYYSRPGFYAAVGDEIPILALTANGIAVFAMNSSLLSQQSHDGDFRLEINRVEKPLLAMQWIIRKLSEEGIVDPDRVGITGLSYGAEIAMYAYWKSSMFRATSVASLSWEPARMLFGGLPYASQLEERGFPSSRDEASMRIWRDLSAGLNARASLPPLLLQSPDAEENASVPNWFDLRRAGAPIEWYEYPDEGHVKRTPSNKWWVYSRNLDWFRFWLKDEEDPALAKAEQYQRWREMRSSWEAAKEVSGSAKTAR